MEYCLPVLCGAAVGSCWWTKENNFSTSKLFYWDGRLDRENNACRLGACSCRTFGSVIANFCLETWPIYHSILSLYLCLFFWFVCVCVCCLFVSVYLICLFRCVSVCDVFIDRLSSLQLLHNDQKSNKL